MKKRSKLYVPYVFQHSSNGKWVVAQVSYGVDGEWDEYLKTGLDSKSDAIEWKKTFVKERKKRIAEHKKAEAERKAKQEYELYLKLKAKYEHE